MKTRNTFFAITLSLISTSLLAQVQINKPIQLTGGSGERVITNLEAPVNGTDAVNKDYVDAAVAASGGTPITMISNESPSSLTYGAAMQYCHNLSEGGHSDWTMPTYDELTYAISTGTFTVSSPGSGNYIWFRNVNLMQYSGTYWYPAFRFSDGVFPRTNIEGANSYYARCVR